MKKLNKSQIMKIRKMVREKINAGLKTTEAIAQVALELDIRAGSVYHHYYRTTTKVTRARTKKVKAPKATLEPTNRITIPIKSLYIEDNALVVEFSNLSNLTFPICY